MENILFIKSSSEGLQMNFISSESHSDQEIPKYISSNKKSEITEVTTKNSIEEGIDEEVFNFLYENLISNSKEEIVKHMKEFAIYIRDNILI